LLRTGGTREGVFSAVKAVPASTKDTASVEFASVAEKATTAKPGALEPWAEGEAGCGCNTAPQDESTEGEHVLEAPLPQRDRAERTLEALPQGAPTAHKHERALPM